MTDDQKEFEQMMDRAAEHFKDKQVVESSVLVNKSTLTAIEQALKSAKITALVFSLPMEERHVGMIKDTGSRPEDFLLLKIVVEQKDAKKMIDALSGTGFSTHKTAQAKMMEAFFDDDNKENPQ